MLSHNIEKSKESYENKIANEVKTNPKQFWKYVRNKTKSKGKINELLDNEGNKVTDDKKKAEILNNHFASVFTREDTTNKPLFNINSDSLIIIENNTITEASLTKHLKALQISKASGPDGINTRISKELAEQISTARDIIWKKYHQGNSTVSKTLSKKHGKISYQIWIWMNAYLLNPSCPYFPQSVIPYCN